eukprot:TRINITY_DN6321_c0_g1_i4.p1 TRINITY_DN6321_c0_g1~~TRINITY_DN6321_c0_g1_i4.p1  ORF type:complete len:172 (+),score=20.65 TRINITY_DN6321_c0_g1_i4:167-682(+)
MKFVHYGCLNSWINVKLETEHRELVSEYYWNTFECEICKTFYPYCISHNGTRYPLIKITKPPRGSFIILESLNTEQGSSRFINILRFTPSSKSLTLGRGHDADMRISDISVSRMHALITCTSEGIYLEDDASKFGTLVLADRVELGPSLQRAVQVGRTIVRFEVKPSILQR